MEEYSRHISGAKQIECRNGRVCLKGQFNIPIHCPNGLEVFVIGDEEIHIVPIKKVETKHCLELEIETLETENARLNRDIEELKANIATLNNLMSNLVKAFSK
jgi:FtsZ-binding cell division protein ZapB